MTYAKLGIAGAHNSWHMRESWQTSLVKQAPKGQENGQAKKVIKIREVDKKCQQIFIKGRPNKFATIIMHQVWRSPTQTL